MQKTLGTYIGANNRINIFDILIPEIHAEGIILFLHGFMGYKDWGCWNLVQEYFSDRGYIFVKYNISHGGTTPEHPREFYDLDAFANNTYSMELFDLNQMIRLIRKEHPSLPIHLIGHSRGGGIALLESKNSEISSITSWAGICDIGIRFPANEALEIWKLKGVRYQANGRTKQDLPMNFSIYTDYLENKARLDIEQYCKESSKPTCIIHGADDISVDVTEGEKLSQWLNVKLILIENANHTFNSAEPWPKPMMPYELQLVCKQTYNFILSNGK